MGFAGGAPLVFGGDLNLSPSRCPAAFRELERRLGLAPPTAQDAIDHLLVRGLRVREAPAPLPPKSREVAGADGRAIRLSDHSLVAGTFEME